MNVFYNYDLTTHNTFGMHVKCYRFLEYYTVEELLLALEITKNDVCLPLFLGGGSNILFTGDYAGTVLCSAIRDIEYHVCDNEIYVRVGSGVTWDNLVKHCIDNGWYGIENLSLIPGSVGGAIVQNIGAFGVEAKDVIYNVEAIDIYTKKTVLFSKNECGYAYRHSNFKSKWRGRYAITHATLRLCRTFVPHLDYKDIRIILKEHDVSKLTAMQLRNFIIEMRHERLPDLSIMGNAGSFFTNPIVPKSLYEKINKEFCSVPHYTLDNDKEKIPAAWLIEQCGWKGRAIGRVAVYDKQALVIVNLGNALPKDILQLYDAIRDDVQKTFNINLNPEVVFV